MVETKYKEKFENDFDNFEAITRYSGNSLIITIPMSVRRKLRLKPGDRIYFRVQKKGAYRSR